MRAVASMDLDGDVREAGNVGKSCLVGVDRLRLVDDQGDDRAMMAGPQPPDMKVGDTVVALLQSAADRLHQGGIGRGIEQHGAGVADQAPRPLGDHDRAQDADRGIEPGPAIGPGASASTWTKAARML